MNNEVDYCRNMRYTFSDIVRTIDWVFEKTRFAVERVKEPSVADEKVSCTGCHPSCGVLNQNTSLFH